MKKMSRILALLLAVVLTASLTACGGSANTESSDGAAAAAEERTEPLVMTFGSCNATDDALSLICYKMSELLEERSDGMLKIDYYPASQLGNETELLDQILSGSLDMGCISVNVCSQIWPDLALFSMPFAFDDPDEFWNICYDPEFFEATKKVYEEAGDVQYIGPYFCGFRDIQNTKHPITCLDDFSDLNFRVMAGEIYTDTYQALGSSTATISFDELYTALQQGVVDGEDCTVFTAYLQGFFDIEKYETQFCMTAASNPLVVAKGTWDKMTPDEQALFMECYKEAEAYGIPINRDMITEYQGKAREAGVEIIPREELSDEVMDELWEAVQPVWEKYGASIDPDYMNLYLETREKLKNAE